MTGGRDKIAPILDQPKMRDQIMGLSTKNTEY